MLGGLITLGGAAAAAGAGTFALFSDTESSTGNTLSAGTLNLTIDTNDGTPTTTVNITDIEPGASGTAASTLENTGNLAGSVDVVYGTATNNEGSNPEPEGDTGSPGDLGSLLEVTVSVGGTQLRSGTFDAVFDGTEDNANVALGPGSTAQLTVDWSLPSSVGNDVQGDECIADMTVQLNQRDSQ